MFRFLITAGLSLLLLACQSSAPHPAAAPEEAATGVPTIIFDTDIGGDIDDLGALYALHVYTDRGQCDIAAVMSSWAMEHHVAGIDAINTHFGRGDLPVGRFTDQPFSKEEYTWFLAEEYPADLTYATAPDAVPLYRELLAAAPDTSLTIVVTGRVNNIYKLMLSAPDSLSEMGGTDLIARKVKEFFIMGGNYPVGKQNEANFRWSGPGVAKYVLENSPRPITLNGGDIGNSKDGYGTGHRMNALPDDHMVRHGYRYFFQNPPDWSSLTPSDSVPDWSIWDIITVQLAVTGARDYFGVVDQGSVTLDTVGITTWHDAPDGPHRYVTPKMDPQAYAKQVIEPLLLAAPGGPRMSGNPIADGWYADPEGIVLDGRYWIFPTYSDDFDKQLHLDAFSSPDLVEWTRHERVLDTTIVPWVKQAMWAPSVIEHRGKYYLFFAGNDIQNPARPGYRPEWDKFKEGGIGVAVADDPAGPYTDHIGGPLLGEFHNMAQPIDQFVYRDDDGAVYFFYGGWGRCNLGRLNDDFTGFLPWEDGELFHEVTQEGYVEGPFMFKRGETYYFMWSEGGWTNDTYKVAYATAPAVTGPYTRIGTILEADRDVATGAGHHSVMQVPGRDEFIMVYHRRPIPNEDRDHRVTCLDKLEFNADGTIKPVRMTFTGVEARPLVRGED